MRILFLDDMDERKAEFVKNNVGHVVHCVKNADEALRYLRAQPKYDIVSLDHDLDPGAYAGTPEEKTGYDVAKAMVSDEVIMAKLPKLAIVHSLNVVGANNMVDALQWAGVRAVRIPFAWMRTYSEDWVK